MIFQDLGADNRSVDCVCIYAREFWCLRLHFFLVYLLIVLVHLLMGLVVQDVLLCCMTLDVMWFRLSRVGHMVS